MKKKLFLVILLTISCLCFATEKITDTNQEIPQKGIGVIYSNPNYDFPLSGISYQQWINNDFGFEINFNGFLTTDAYQFSGTFDLQKKLYTAHNQKNPIVFFAWYTNGFSCNSYYCNEYTENGSCIKTKKHQATYVTGFGFGEDIVFSNYFSIFQKFGYTGFINNTPSAVFSYAVGCRYRF